MPKNKKIWNPCHLRAWRKDREMTLEQLAKLCMTTASNISRVELGKSFYAQPLIEMAARALRTNPSDIIGRAPGAQDRILTVLGQMPPHVHEQALAVLELLMVPNDNVTTDAFRPARPMRKVR